MSARKLTEGIFEVGARDWERRLFDELIPLPDGTSYNSYLILGSEKTALIDTVDPKTFDQILANLKKLKIKAIDYIIANHAEQDHSGSIPALLEIFTGAKVVTNSKCKAMLIDLLHIGGDRFIVKEDHETLTLGGKTLEFIIFPWVHWPETMLTYAREDRILFSCDLFGSHTADSRLFIEKDRETGIKEPAFRYFAEIMYPFRSNIAGNFEKITSLDISMIAPSHGAVYTNPGFIIECYREWISDRVVNKVVIPFVSMHGSVRAMTDYLMDALIDRGIEVKPFDLTASDVGKLAMALTDAATVVVGVPTVLGGMHPWAAYAVYLYNLLRPKTKFVTVIGSYGWGGKALEQIKSMLYNVKAEILAPVIIKGLPGEKELSALDALADCIASKHKEIGII
ncbi:MAG: FprA family A-type flavoprotein [Brevinematales bacterium]|jgi:flavorubredoxin